MDHIYFFSIFLKVKRKPLEKRKIRKYLLRTFKKGYQIGAHYVSNTTQHSKNSFVLPELLCWNAVVVVDVGIVCNFFFFADNFY